MSLLTPAFMYSNMIHFMAPKTCSYVLYAITFDETICNKADPSSIQGFC